MKKFLKFNCSIGYKLAFLANYDNIKSKVRTKRVIRLAQVSYSTSYTNCLHSFIICGLPRGQTKDPLLHSFTCVLKNILARGKTVRPSAFLQNVMGKVISYEQPVALLKKDAPLPSWALTIKGNEDGFNPAREFYYSDELWSNYFTGYEWVRQLMIPEAPITEILNTTDKSWINQTVDFYLPAARLVIEIDGKQHEDPWQEKVDKERDTALAGAGVQTIRIPVKDLLEHNDNFDSRIDAIIEILQNNELISFYQNQENNSSNKRRILYETILRYQFLLLELIDRGTLTFGSSPWIFNISDSKQRLFCLACQDLFLWFQNLYQLKGLPFDAPKIQFSKEPGVLRLSNLLFSRPDEREVTCPTVFTSAWDGKDYYHVACAEPVDYEIPWPIPDDEERGTALKFFLHELFGYREFKDGQWQIVANFLLLRRTIGILPTGGGKSLCYQLAAMLQPGMTFVICPINSLQIDQKRNLDEAGITHTDYIASLQDAKEKQEILRKLELGKDQIIWISPERFQSRRFREIIRNVSQSKTIAYNVIDEVHCLSEWGHDFRTSYLTLIGSLKKTCPNTAIIGLTATASQAVLDDLKIEFDIDGSNIRALPSLQRTNLTFNVAKISEKEKDAKVLQILQEHHYGEENATPETGLIFTLTRDQSDNPFSKSRNKLKQKLCASLPDNAKQIDLYHSDVKDKVDVQEKFLNGDLRLLSTTKAFGMGINKRDLRFTVHYSLPWSVESFYQEAGRAGRDDKPAVCTILYTPDDFGSPDAITKAFGQSTSPENIKELVDKKQLKGDLSTIFHLWGGNNKGVETDVYMIEQVLDRINQTPPRIDSDGSTYFTIASDFSDKEDDKLAHPKRLTKERLELALYRLKLLGDVEDWLIDWTGKPVHFDVYLDPQRSADHSYDCLIQYLRKHREEKFTPEKLNSNTDRVTALKYAKSLVQWTYDHIAYTRREATNQIRNLCEHYQDPVSFRENIDGFLRISELTITLDGILDHQDLHELWFRAFYSSSMQDNWVRTEDFLKEDGIRQLRLSAAQYRTSYRDVTGLNFVYVLSGLFSGYTDLSIETPLLHECFQKINEMEETAREDIWAGLRVLVEHYHGNMNTEMKDGLASCLAQGFPDKSREIYQLLEDPHSLAVIIQDATARIRQAASVIRR